MSAMYLPYTHDCFACGASNQHGLQLRFRAENGEILADFRPKPHHTGYTGMVHGGVVASALDETMFWAAAYARKQFHVSVELSVRYRKKVDAAQSYLLVARLTREQKKFCFTEGELRDAAGHVCAAATGKYFLMRAEDVPLSLEDFCADPQTLSPMEFFSHPR
jgi:acyl-coenzyme A thioesterase PaaI-like protein